MKKVVPRDAVLIPKTAKLVFKGQIFNVYQWQQLMFDGSSAKFEMLRRPDTVIAICIDDNQILVIDYEQPNVGDRIAFPAGRVDASDSSTLSAIQREVKEETGYEFDEWKLILSLQTHTKLEWFTYFYLAWDGQKRLRPKLDAGEKIKLKLLSFDEVKQLVLNRAGFLGGADVIFRDIKSIQKLLDQPEFQGKEIDR